MVKELKRMQQLGDVTFLSAYTRYLKKRKIFSEEEINKILSLGDLS
jgi:hypothetical protein